MNMMNKVETVQALQRMSRENAYLVNVIEGWHRNPARKINGLYNLLKAEHTVRIAQFDIGTLIIDGCKAPWAVLEEWATRTA